MARRGPNLAITVETVHPATARKWLEGNTRNRKVSPKLVEVYAETILAGEWRLNGEPIIFDRNNRLQSGQHRLLAVIEADHPIRTVVVRNAEPDSLFSLDSGRKRRMVDALTLRGEKDVAILSSALSWLWRYRTQNMQRSGEVATNVHLLKLLDDTPEIRDSIVAARPTKRILHFSVGLVAALHLEMDAVDAEDTKLFFEGVIEGAGLHSGDPRLALRNWAARTEMSARRPSQAMIAAIVIKAFNAYRDTRELKILAFKPSEKFPEIGGA
jgi:hypothetical protein